MRAPRSFRLIAAAAVLLARSAHAQKSVPPTQPSARALIERITTRLGGTWSPDDIDSFKAGDPDVPVSGIAVTMFATMDVLEQAAAAGANLIIVHEPTFYSHEDRLAPLEAARDAITAEKRAFMRDHNIVVFRLHDHWHFPLRTPDPFVTGFFRELGWQHFQTAAADNVVTLPSTTLRALASDLAHRLKVRTVRVVGDSLLRVTRVAFAPGFSGFAVQRSALERDDVDALIIGEAHEWETIAWAADAQGQHRRKALIVLGHVASEQPGMIEFHRWLADVVPDVRTVMIRTAEPFWRP